MLRQPNPHYERHHRLQGFYGFVKYLCAFICVALTFYIVTNFTLGDTAESNVISTISSDDASQFSQRRLLHYIERGTGFIMLNGDWDDYQNPERKRDLRPWQGATVQHGPDSNRWRVHWSTSGSVNSFETVKKAPDQSEMDGKHIPGSSDLSTRTLYHITGLMDPKTQQKHDAYFVSQTKIVLPKPPKLLHTLRKKVTRKTNRVHPAPM